jgi:hypothetical protein
MEMSPEKSETMEFLGQDSVKCTIIVYNKYLQKIKDFNYLDCAIYENEKIRNAI